MIQFNENSTLLGRKPDLNLNLKFLSLHRVSQKKALRGSRIDNFHSIYLAAWSRELLICVSSSSFQKSSIDWPQQPPTNRVSDISEKLDF